MNLRQNERKKNCYKKEDGDRKNYKSKQLLPKGSALGLNEKFTRTPGMSLLIQKAQKTKVTGHNLLNIKEFSRHRQDSKVYDSKLKKPQKRHKRSNFWEKSKEFKNGKIYIFYDENI